ncbi:MAG TPA: PEP-CTERM sorting domain-containing protein [Isosphaeraceae bacterium]
MNARFVRGLLIGLVLATPRESVAGLVQLFDPEATYQGASTLIPITGPDNNDVDSLGDGVLTIDFSHTREVHSVPGGGWNTWSSAPDAESATPRVLGGDNFDISLSSLTMTFDRPVYLFGVEAEPETFDTWTFTATFFNGGDVVGSFSRDIFGSAGARLLAARATDGDLFTRVDVTTGTNFALAQFRYSLTPVTVPEPSALLLLGLGSLGLGGYIRRRRAARA